MYIDYICRHVFQLFSHIYIYMLCTTHMRPQNCWPGATTWVQRLLGLDWSWSRLLTYSCCEVYLWRAGGAYATVPPYICPLMYTSSINFKWSVICLNHTCSFKTRLIVLQPAPAPPKGGQLIANLLEQLISEAGAGGEVVLGSHSRTFPKRLPFDWIACGVAGGATSLRELDISACYQAAD